MSDRVHEQLKNLQLYLFCSFKCVKIETVFFPPDLFLVFFYILVFVLPFFANCSGARSAGFFETGSGDLCRTSQSKLDVEGGKSGNDAGEDLDRNSRLSFGMDPYRITGNFFTRSTNPMKRTKSKEKMWERFEGLTCASGRRSIEMSWQYHSVKILCYT